ncbi:MAG: T9SS type A sorting domain-containing protein, partial [bacterium]
VAINSSGDIFVGTLGGGVFRSTDNGETWTQTNNGLKPTEALAIAINSSGHIFVGNSTGGVFRSTDNGDNWTQINSGLTNTNIQSFAINSSGQIFAGTDGSGVFRSVRSTTSVKGITDEIPTSFSLEQNYPNPFNPNTTIQFSLPRPGYVTLEMYNSLGEEVMTLVANYLSAGKYKVDWDARGLASGVYYYRLKVGGFFETKRLILMK